MNMLDNGKIPKLFTWKESMEAYLQHLKTIIIKAYQYDLSKLLDRIHILEGLIVAFHNIEDLVKDIRSSKNTESAKQLIMKNYDLSEKQAEAILKMRLSSLTHLEIEKLENERNQKQETADRIQLILESEEKIKEEMIKEIQTMAEKYGDKRRTKCINLDFTSEDEDAEPIEKKELLIHYTNLNNIYTQESSTLLTQKRGGKGAKIKLAKGETIIETLADDNFSSLMVFTTLGRMFVTNTSELPVNSKINLKSLFDFEDNEEIATITTYEKKDAAKYFVFLTKNGMIKKTLSREYTLRKGRSLKAINLKDGDSVVNVLFVNDENVGILTRQGNFIIIETTDITAIGRATAGVKAIKLLNDEVIDAKIVAKNTKSIVSVTKNGLIKKSSIDEFGICNRGIKGNKIQKINENDNVVQFKPIGNDEEIIVISNNNILKFNSGDIRESNRMTLGVKAMELKDNEYVVGII
jgi:DNA gyrase subunit A